MVDKYTRFHASYAVDTENKISYVSFDSVTAIANINGEDLSALILSPPLELNALCRGKLIELVELVVLPEAETVEKESLFMKGDDFLNILHYQVIFNWQPTGKKKTDKEMSESAIALLLELYHKGTYTALHDRINENLALSVPTIQVKTFDVPERIALKLKDHQSIHRYNIVMQREYVNNPSKWLVAEDPAMFDFFDKWDNLIYGLLTGIDDMSLLSAVPFAKGGYVIGLRYYTGSTLMNLVERVKAHVEEKYSETYNNLEKLIIEGAIKAVLDVEPIDEDKSNFLKRHSPAIASNIVYHLPADTFWFNYMRMPSLENFV